MMTAVAAESVVCGVTRAYACPDRGQLFLMPVSMRDWVPAGHLVWFVLETVERMDTGGLHARPGGCPGRRPYLPEMMLALVLYAYCQGMRSSRVIEQHCLTDAAFRVIGGGLRPDHCTISRFVVTHQRALEDLFVDGLRLCAQAGLCDLSVVALDGTKIAADASIARNRDGDWLRGQIAKAMVVTADDQLPEPVGCDQLPGLHTQQESCGNGEIMRLRSALAVIEADEAVEAAARVERVAEVEIAARAAAAQNRKPAGGPSRKDPAVELVVAQAALAVEQDRDQARAAERARIQAAAHAEGRSMTGPVPRLHRDLKRAQARVQRAQAAVSAAAVEGSTPASDATRRVNLTDPDSRIMTTKDGWVQGYNCQAIANPNHIVLAVDVSQHPGDVQLFESMNDTLTQTLAAAGITAEVELELADAGYCSEHNLTIPGPLRLIATRKDHKQRAAARKLGLTDGPPPPGLTDIQEMEHLLRTPQGAAAYQQRSSIIEPIFGNHKHNHGLRRFRRRGLEAVRSEWAFANLAGNLRKLYEHHTTQLA